MERKPKIEEAVTREGCRVKTTRIVLFGWFHVEHIVLATEPKRAVAPRSQRAA